MHCLKAADTCSDASLRCAENHLENCFSVVPPDEGQDLDFGAMNAFFGSTVFLWQLCPKTCNACEGQRQLDEAAIARVRSPCQEGWSYADGSCFRYFADPSRKYLTFRDAKAECEREGASLAEVDTPFKNHLVFELVRQRPQTPFNIKGWTPWIGLRLRTGAECGPDPQSWYWVASNRSLSLYNNWALHGSPSTGMLYSIPTCNASSHRCVLLNFPHEHYYWHDVGCGSQFTNSWICSKPASVRPTASGSCGDLGMEPITSFDACEAALKAIGQPVVRNTQVTNAVPRPEGCSWNIYHGSLLSLNPANRGQGSTLLYFNNLDDKVQQMQVCQQKANLSNSSEAGLPSELRPYPTQAPPETSLQQAVSEELAAALCLICACLSMLLLWRWRVVATGAVASLQSTCCTYLCAWWRCSKLESDDVLGVQVQLGLAQRRQQVAVLAAGAHLTYRLLRLVLDHLVEDVSCQSSRATRIGILGAEVLEICLAAAMLASDGGRCRGALIWCWVLLLPASRLWKAALMGGESLIATSRPVEDLLWRLLHGAVMRPPVALAVNALYTGGSLMLYWSMIPDGMVYLTDGSGCVELYTQKDVEIIVEAQNVAKLLRYSADVDWNRLASNFLSTLLHRTTSLARFAGLELLTLALVFICLALLAHLMAVEIRSNLKLQSTEKLLSAVSEMLQRLCDAVVHVDGSLRITRPSPRFATLLHYPTSAAGRGSMSFRERLADRDEEERVRAALHAGQDAKSTEILSASFRDSLGVAVPCQIFHATFTSLDGQPSHVLGINEVGERDHLPLAPLRSSNQLAVSQQQPGHQSGAESRLLAQPRGDGGAPPASESLALPSSSDSESDNSPAVERQMDMQLYDFTIVRANAGTAHLLGNDPTGSMLDSLVSGTDEWQALVRWQVETLQKLHGGEMPEVKVQTLGPFHVNLRPHLGGGKRTQSLQQSLQERHYLVVLEVTFPDIDMEPFDIETYTVSIRILSAKRMRMELPAPSPASSTEGSAGHGRRKHRHRRAHSQSKVKPGGTQASMERRGFSGPARAEGEAEVASLCSDLSLGKESL